MATTELIDNGVQEEIALNRVIKALQEITVHNEYESPNHALEFGEKNNVFFVKLDGAVIYAGKDGKHAVAMFYDQISKIDRDEKSDADPEFSTLREILISRNKHVKESLARLGHHALANSLDALDFAKSEFSHIYKSILLKTDSEQLSFDGYNTKNFDMCPTSVEEFGNVIEGYKEEKDDPWFEDEFEEAKEAILRAMKATDIYLGIEKKVVGKEKVSVGEIKRMVAAIEDSHHFIGELGRIIGDDLSGKFDYSSGHLMTVLKYHEGDAVSKGSVAEEFLSKATAAPPVDYSAGWEVTGDPSAATDTGPGVTDPSADSFPWSDADPSAGGSYFSPEPHPQLDVAGEIGGGLANSSEPGMAPAGSVPAAGASAAEMSSASGVGSATGASWTGDSSTSTGSVGSDSSSSGTPATPATPASYTPPSEAPSVMQAAGDGEIGKRRQRIKKQLSLPVEEIIDSATNELGDDDKWHTHKEEEAFVPERESTDTDKIVKAIIPGSDNSVLLLTDVRTPFWDLPGGHVKVDEDPEDALYREVQEETGLDIVMAKKLMTRPLYVGNPVQEQREITFYWVSATGEITLSDEHDLHVWAPFEKIREMDLGSFAAILTDLGKKVGGEIPSFEAKEEGVAQVMDASESEVDNVHNYSPRDKTRMGQTKTVQTRASDPQVENLYIDKQIAAAGGGYSEAGGPRQREKNPIDPTNPKRDNGGRHAMATAETPASQAFSSGAVIDLPEDEAAEKGVQKNASGGAGTAGDGSPPAGGTGGVIAHSNVSDSTYGGGMGGNQGRPQSGSKGGRVREDYDSNLKPLHKQQDMTVIGTAEGISTLPNDGATPERGKTKNSITRHTYEEVERRDRDQRASALPPEQRPLGSGEVSIWLANDDNPKRFLADEDGENIEPDGSRKRTIIPDGQDTNTKIRPHSPNFDPAVEQYTNLSSDEGSHFKDLSSYVAKSADSPNDFDGFKSLVPDPVMKMDLGKTLVVGGWGSVYVVDREGHRINLEGLDKALKKFLANPDFANVNIFHSGIQVGKLIPKFVDAKGKVWKTHVNKKGLFAVVAFRTDLEVSRRAMAEVIKGNLRGFSLSGNSNPETKEIRCEHGSCWQEIMDLEIYELTLCQEPMNQDSWITDIIQKPDAETCPECYSSPPQAKRYDSSLRPVMN